MNGFFLLNLTAYMENLIVWILLLFRLARSHGFHLFFLLVIEDRHRALRRRSFQFPKLCLLLFLGKTIIVVYLIPFRHIGLPHFFEFSPLLFS